MRSNIFYFYTNHLYRIFTHLYNKNKTMPAISGEYLIYARNRIRKKNLSYYLKQGRNLSD